MFPFLAQIVQQLLGLAGEPARVAAYVDAKCDNVLLKQPFDRVDRFIRAAGFKIVDLHIARIRLFLAVIDGALVRPSAVHLQLIPAGDPEREFAVELGADQCPGLVLAEAADILPVHGGQEHARGDSRLRGGGSGIDGNDAEIAVLFLRDRHADARILVCRGELIARVFIGRHVIAPLVAQARDHGRRSGLAHLGTVGRVDEVLLHGVLDLDIAHRLVIVFPAADLLDHLGIGQPHGETADENDQDQRDLQRDPEIEKAGEKSADRGKKAL